MAVFCVNTLGLSAYSLWMTARTTRASIRAGDWQQARTGLGIIKEIEANAEQPSLAASARSIRASLAGAVSDSPQFPSTALR